VLPVVGVIVEILFAQGFNGWFRGSVTGLDDVTGKHLIDFDDGQKIEMDLRYENWQVSQCTEPRSSRLTVKDGFEMYGFERKSKQRELKPAVRLAELCEAASCAPVLQPQLPCTLGSAARLLGLSGGGVKIVGRQSETNRIVQFVEAMMTAPEGQPNALFVCGMPGSGKSAVVAHVCKQVALWPKARHGGFMHLLELNAMHILEAKTIYSKISRALMGDNLAAVQCSTADTDARQRLLSQISTAARSRLLLVVDEVDQLHTRDEEVLYDLFEMAARPNSRLCLIGIANSLNMTERFLPRLHESNAVPDEISFEPYSPEAIADIVKSRLPEPHTSLLDHQAIKMCATKVASSGCGDIRKALDICRAAVAHAMEDNADKVGLRHMAGTIKKLMGSKHVATCLALPQAQQVMLCALKHVFNGETQKDVPLIKLHEGYRAFCKAHQMTPLSKGELVDVLSILDSQGLLAWSGSAQKKQVRMLISEGELRQALEKIGDGSFFRNLLDTPIVETVGYK